ncbi:MarR family winged helix-turn-helix transcriptional regulator [Oceanicella sp. SM1341]|uniref:MarR family winged helix-turn-helix transcriptional regulator n=1 Tax=Oceanicella sp. SM1341 TaxID=1548889 RepID=UPI000E53FAE5|nr:MarR family winged helix-turn-helix transcriptional regulator [Oceanicella sp. SM1341]
MRNPLAVPGTADEDPLTVALLSEILSIEQHARTRIQRALPAGMQLSHYMVLTHFARQGGERTPAQLARIFQVTRGAMTNTLQRLDEAGYIHIRPDWDDGRRKYVSASRAGLEARQRAVAAVAPLFSEMAERLGPEKLRAVLPVLRSMRILLDAREQQ